ncbi:hypothetical protein EMIHUDRAFT_457924 [Emiliania huxleyi CCMP1516]|uniref:TRPM SLOG domain-containing protein n=2 Tax=Emiliania huxleyi TaxID=2903 RepID=A0A0D3JJL6_EMIH1|nr:hypothetical protein EMIHUDRAFT_457924 [Emiliania huxleyi CCMP1516]EOD23701.1 hypothetical protein EMIHUDRAFT_457924 [Emiliania huxleyi CCMP1516]|eukprot:XP_005776130.1 hypothetical protein EMIHUDRAFT_457924 [Emiliania huxleyi CCMP1516]
MRCFGPAILCRSGGDPSDFGDVNFPELNTQSKFLVLADTSTPQQVSRFVEKFWGLEKPEIIISVTGSALDFELHPILQRAFDKGLTAAASAANAWVITGGTDTGVMKLVASSLSSSGVSMPILGFSPFGAINEREKLERVYGGASTMVSTKATKDGAPLNAHHTHFLLVDSGKHGVKAWGTEINLRVAFESFYLERKSVPMVLLVVQGGPGTLATVLETAKKGSPIVVVADSGGAATAIKQYIEGDGEGSLSNWTSPHGKVEDLAVKFGTEKPLGQLREIRKCNEESGGKLITLFQVNNDGVLEATEDMSNVLLQAIVRLWVAGGGDSAGRITPPDRPGTPSSLAQPALALQESNASLSSQSMASPESSALGIAPESSTLGTAADPLQHAQRRRRMRAIQLAVKWNRPLVVEEIFSEAAPPEGGRAVALQYALELRRYDVIRLLMGYQGFSLQFVNLCKLYLVPNDGFLDSDEKLQKELLTNQGRIRDTTHSPRRSYECFQDVIGIWLKNIDKAEGRPGVLSLSAFAETAPHFAHLFTWSVFLGEYSIADLFWRECDDPARVALLGSHQCLLIGNKMVTSKSRLEEQAERYEQVAVDVINAADSQTDAFAVLEHKEGRFSLLDLALQLEMKRFLAHRHCQALLDRMWNGRHAGSSVELPENISMTALLWRATMPLTNPHYTAKARSLYQKKTQDEASKKANACLEGGDMGR